MISDFKIQTDKSVLNFVRQLGHNPNVYSHFTHGLGRHLADADVYLYAFNDQVLVVAIDPTPATTPELADEEPFEGNPLYFNESSHRTSPVWQLALTCRMLQQRLDRLSKKGFAVWGGLLTESYLINYDDMDPFWKAMQVTVCHNMRLSKTLALDVNDDATMAEGRTLATALATEFTFTDEQTARRQLIADLKGKPAAEEAPALFNFDSFEDDDAPVSKEHDDDDADFEEAVKSWFGYLDDDAPELPSVSDGGKPDALTMLRSEIHDRCTDMQNDFSVELNVWTGAKGDAPCYADGSAVVKFTAPGGSYFELDAFSCYVYSDKFYPMCHSKVGDYAHRSKGRQLMVEMPCQRVWVPGGYLLIIRTKDGSLCRYDFTLDERLNATLGPRQHCLPCGREDILLSCLEDANTTDWPVVACRPGMAQLRMHAVKCKQLDVYNEYRSSLHAGRIGSSQNLLITTRNRDVDERLLGHFRCVLGYCGGIELLDCSTLYDASRPNPYEALNDCLESAQSEVICLTNVTALLSTGGKVIVKKVLDVVRDPSKSCALWICGTHQETTALLETFPSLCGLFLRGNRIEQEPYNGFELVQAFFSQLDEERLVLGSEVKDALARAILRGFEQGMLGVWTLDDIRRFVVEEIRPRYLEHALSDILDDELPSLSEEDLCLSLLTTGQASFEESIRELNTMIGLDEVKEGIISMANNARLYQERRRQGLRTSEDMVFHSIFTGNPGTGKTTVARMLGRIYRSLGLLSKGEVVAVDRTRLVGRYIGETEENMKQVLEEARGNVLFIDEAYTLYDGSGDRKDFGCRVLDSLLTVLTQPNPDMLVVFAGYEREMDAMLSTNPGLSGRFPYRYLFKDYSSDQLFDIALRLFSRDEYILTDEAADTLRDAIAQALHQRVANFGNARWVEQFVRNGIIPSMAMRVFSTGSTDLQHIEAADVRRGYEKFNPKANELKPRRKVAGFSA